MATPAFIPALFGSDIGAYSLARSFYEMYGVTSYVFGKYPTGPCRDSKIIAFEADPAIDTEPVLERTLTRVASSTDAAVLALGVGDGYVRLLSGCASRMPKNAIVPYLDNGQLDRLILKENFYRLCGELGIDRRSPSTPVRTSPRRCPSPTPSSSRRPTAPSTSPTRSRGSARCTSPKTVRNSSKRSGRCGPQATRAAPSSRSTSPATTTPCTF